MNNVGAKPLLSYLGALPCLRLDSPESRRMHTAPQQARTAVQDREAAFTKMAVTESHRQDGPIRVWLRPHARGERGEALAVELLSAALGTSTLSWRRDAHGRPQLQGEHARFDANWSHSGDLLLVALGEAVEVGVDLEHLRPRPRAMELAQRFFHADETARLLALPSEARALFFVRLWCAKEAVLKAHGQGISFGLEKLVFDERDGELRLVACDRALGMPEDWQLREWEPQSDYRAALAWRPA